MKKLAVLVSAFSFSILTLISGSFAATWQVPGDFSTVQNAIDSPLVIQGDTIMLAPGEHAGAFITKPVTIKGEGGAVINSGPSHPSGLSQGFRLMSGSDGATVSHLKFRVDLAIMNGAGVDDVTVSHCYFENPVQAVSNWGGSGWEISHNEVVDLRTRNGGGIGILVADSSGGVVQDNVVSHNKVMGTLHVCPDDGGGYDGSGIVLYADFRWNRLGADHIQFNRVVKNKISLVSDTPDVVDVNAFELTDTRGDAELCCSVIHDNAIGFNDFRGTFNQILLWPDGLSECNDISRNLGDNRGHGSHPRVFGPNTD